jgi:hypothetical protein
LTPNVREQTLSGHLPVPMIDSPPKIAVPYETAGSRPARRYFTIGLMAAILLVGGAQIPIVGTAFVLDFMIPIAAITLLALDSRARASFAASLPLFAISFCFLIAFTAADLYNGIAVQWLLRGFGRNIACLESIILGTILLGRFGLKVFLLVMTLVLLSLPCYMLLSRSPDVQDPIQLFKYYNGTAAVIPILALVRRHARLTALTFFLFAGFLFTVVEFRSGAAIAACIGIWTLSLPYLSKVKPWVTGIALLVLLPITINAALVWARALVVDDPNRTLQMDLSNSIRTEMALDAVARITARPITGYGSWQHVLLFTSETESFHGAMQGVHSIPLQLGFEYGLAGLLLSAVVAVLLIRVLSRITYWAAALKQVPQGLLPLCVYVVVVFTNDYVFGAIMGFDRFTFGLGLAFLVWIDRAIVQASRQRHSQFVVQW